MTRHKSIFSNILFAAIAALTLTLAVDPAHARQSDKQGCKRTISADVVALDQPFMFNRLGAAQPQGMVFALKRDVVPNTGDGSKSCEEVACQAGHVVLRPDKRARPLTLRMNVGDCLQVNFTNLLNPGPPSGEPIGPLQPKTREAGLHAFGMQMVGSINSDGSWVGANPGATGSLVAPNGSTAYTFFAGAEGTFLLYSTAADFGVNAKLDGKGGQLTSGLFGAVNVQPENAEWYRSQVTGDDLKLAAKKDASGNPVTTNDGHPVINYDACYPEGRNCADLPPSAVPILRMLNNDNKIVHSDLTAIITGPNAGRFSYSENGPEFLQNPASPDRRQPYREFTIIYHEVVNAVQAFSEYYSTPLSTTLSPGGDKFAINYGTAGIGSEILANRLKVGPMTDCTECKFEEFFLSSWAVGDPAMVVDVPANSPNTNPVDPDKISPVTADLATAQVSGKPVTPPLNPLVGRKATKAFFADDPSNVYHSYIRDHTKLRVLHGGAALTHVHHLHAHQWLHSPNSDDGHYLDSQMINPGATFTLEIAYNGSGNLNQTVGDSIFHCHFYPHFAAGMWALWRVHDVFEGGTGLENGVPRTGTWNRALPDGEISAGTPIPALVPLPTLPMAPMPARVKVCASYSNWDQQMFAGNDCPAPPAKGAVPIGFAAVVNQDDLKAGKNPGFPFFVPGIAGRRAPHPPLDLAKNSDYNPNDPNSRRYLDGGLSRYLALGGNVHIEHHNQWDFTKELDSLIAIPLNEEGTAVESVAMRFHAQRSHPSFTPEGVAGSFTTNGLPPAQGAPYAEPGIDLNGNPVTTVRRYKAANVQTDVIFNKKGWHYPQQRFITLWEDVAPTMKGQRAPEPFFFRANTGDVIEYWHTNLVPSYYELDDFQVRTPTDILGQHIHLVKFDVTSSDGAANGFNYEDGTFSPDEVRDVISGIRKQNNCQDSDPVSFRCPKATSAPAVFGPAPPGQDWTGAQTTIQRWYADPLLNNKGEDRTLRTVFTHDHFSPSTHQQAGLYAGLLVEPQGSKWNIPSYWNPATSQFETNVPMYTRGDGGPTSWQADIITKNIADSYREFALEFQDISLAYTRDSRAQQIPYPVDGKYPVDANGYITTATPVWGWAECANAINLPGNCPNKSQITNSNLIAQPQIISLGGGIGTFGLNYRNEPLPFRVWDPSTQLQATGTQGDLSYSFSSIKRADNDFNRQPVYPDSINPNKPDDPRKYPTPLQPISSGDGIPDAVSIFDPYTPLLRVYENDKVQIRTLVGAHLLPHFFSLQGLRWLFEPSSANSGYRASQGMGISEHFEMLFKVPSATTTQERPFADYLYNPDASQSGREQGMWGLLRSYNGKYGQKPGLPFLPNNPTGSAPAPPSGGCPADAPKVYYNVTATTAAQALPALSGQPAGTPGTLVYNSRGAAGTTPPSPMQQPDALIYVRTEDLDYNGKLKPGVPVEPIVLRAAAGDCVVVTLHNAFDPNVKDNEGNSIFSTTTATTVQYAYDPGTGSYKFIDISPSLEVGLHPQLVSYDITNSNGMNLGFNPPQTVKAAAGGSQTYNWYAGILYNKPDGSVTGTPVEFGSINLLPSDPIEQDPLGLVGAMIIEPKGSTWCEDVNSRASATVYRTPVDCKDLKARAAATDKFREFVVVMQNDLSGVSWNGGSTSQSINYRSEPMAYRYPSPLKNVTNIADATANALVGGDPQTPVFVASKGTPTRFRFVHPGGTGDGQNITIHGHMWQEEPYVKNSTEIGKNPVSQWLGSWNHGPEDHRDVIIEEAGGKFKITGDYLYRTFLSDQFQGGMWGIFRVTASDSVVVNSYGPCKDDSSKTCITGTNTVNPDTGHFTNTVTIYRGEGTEGAQLGAAEVDRDGKWTFVVSGSAPDTVTVKSEDGGVVTVRRGTLRRTVRTLLTTQQGVDTEQKDPWEEYQPVDKGEKRKIKKPPTPPASRKKKNQ